VNDGQSRGGQNRPQPRRGAGLPTP
jgi:hypothetical protein